MKIAILGPGGVGGLLAGALEQAGTPVIVVAREQTARVIAEDGLRVASVMFGEMVERPRAGARLEEPVDVLIVATKAAGLVDALARIDAEPGLVLPLLNGLDHLTVLRARFAPASVLAGSIRVEADRPEPGVIAHTSRFLLVEMAPAAGLEHEVDRQAMDELVRTLQDAGVPARVGESQASVMWSKLVRLNALACVTSAYDKLLGEIRDTPALRADLQGAIREACAVGQAEGASDVDPERAIAELEMAHATLGSSMQRDIAAGREPELDAIPGAVLRAAARHGLRCPTIERLVAMIAERAGNPRAGSALDHYTGGVRMDFGVMMFPTDYSVAPGELAAMVEQRGYESLFFPEHTHIPVSRDTPYPAGGELPPEYSQTYDPFVALMAAAAATEGLRVATGICLVIERDPIITAKEVASLDRLSGGRMLFGVGAGWNLEEMANHGTDGSQRFGLLRERIEAMKAIWSQEEASYHGRHVDFDPIWARPKPLQKPHPPILVGGNGASVIDRVLSYGDEWMPNAMPDAQALQQRIREFQARAADERRGRLGVTLYAAPAKAQAIGDYEQAGVHRYVFHLRSAAREDVEQRLDHLDRVIAEYRG